MKKLTAAMVKYKNSLKKTIFELQAMDWRNQDKPIPSTEPHDQVCTLRAAGALSYGYYPDNLIADRSDTEVLRDMISLETYVKTCEPPNGDVVSAEKFNSGAAPQSQPPEADEISADKKPAITGAAALAHASKAGG